MRRVPVSAGRRSAPPLLAGCGFVFFSHVCGEEDAPSGTSKMSRGRPLWTRSPNVRKFKSTKTCAVRLAQDEPLENPHAYGSHTVLTVARLEVRIVFLKAHKMQHSGATVGT